MASSVKCGYCTKKVDKEESESFKRRYYHPKCLRVYKRESEDYQSLIEYVEYLYGENYPFIIIKKQIKEYKDEGMKYAGMRLALEYFYDELNNSIEGSKGVGIIPYVYEDAKAEYIKKQKVKKSIEEYKHETISVTINTKKKINKKNIIEIADI